MRELGKRIAAVLLAMLLAVSILPAQAWAAMGVPAGTSLRYNRSFWFYEKYVSGGEGTFMPPFETTSGAAMFCVDPGVGACIDGTRFNIHVGHGGTGLLDVLEQCKGSSHLSNAESAGGKVDAGTAEALVDPSVLAGLAPDTLDRIIQYMSVLHYYAGQGVFDAPQFGEAYNLYDVYALQNYIWYACNPAQPELWYTISPLNEWEQMKVRTAYRRIINAAAELYGERKLTSFTLADGGASQTTAEGAQAQPLAVSEGDSRSWSAADRSAWSRIQYIAVDGGAVQRFQSGDTARSGSFSITNTGGGITVEITGKADGTAHTAQFLTAPTQPGDESGDWAMFAHINRSYQSFFTAYRAPQSAPMYLSFSKTQEVTLEKVDADTGTGLRGAELQVLDALGNEAARGFTAEGGVFRFPCPAPGEYTWREVTAPAGYALSEEEKTFTVHPDGTVTGELTLSNQRKGLTISKIDASTGKGLPGARVEIRDSENNVIAQGWTDENGYFAFEQPAPGVYKFREISPPAGYELNPREFTFEVKEDGTVEGDLTLPNTGIPTQPDPEPKFPAFTFSQQKLDEQGGFDADCSTPVGDTSLAAGFTLTWRTDKGASGTQTDTANIYGQGASETVSPWGTKSEPADVVTVVEETATWDPCTELDGVEHEAGDEVEYISGYTWTGTCTVTIRESAAPTGHGGTAQSYTHTIEYYAESRRDGPYEEFSPVSYTITVDGRDTGLDTDSAVQATWSSPYQANGGGADVFVNRAWVGALQIIKTQDSDDIFSAEHGQGTVAGGAVGGKDYSTKSLWTLRLVASDGSDAFGGYEGSPYVKVVEDPGMQSSGVGRLMHCYKAMLDGTGTPADSANPLTPSEFGQIYISNLPYGTYLLTEYSAGSDRYVKESMLLTIRADGQTVSTSLHDTAKKNVVRIVKTDAETGKTVPAAGVAFRIRYLGSPEYEDPTKTPNYGRYLPNAASLTSGAHSAEDYIFYTDKAGEVTVPYELPYGSYQVEEILVPEGYYIGKYAEDGKAESTDGNEAPAFGDRVAIFDQNGNKVDYTHDEGVVYNYYAFAVTEQADHLDGEAYQTFVLTVKLPNTAVKGSIEITKLGEALTGWEAAQDEYGNTVMKPVYEPAPLAGVTFGIYAAQDVLLEDGEEPPVAWDKTAGKALELEEQSQTHVQYPNGESVRVGKHEATGAEVVYRIERDAGNGEGNRSYVDYLTPTRKGTRYHAGYTLRDDTAGITWEYEVELGLEYAAGGRHYTEVSVTRTGVSDDYAPDIGGPAMALSSGGTAADYSRSQTLSNGNVVEVLAAAEDERPAAAGEYEVQRMTGGEMKPLPMAVPDEERWSRLSGLPALPEGYSPGEIFPDHVTITNGMPEEDMALVWATRVTEDWEEHAGAVQKILAWAPQSRLGPDGQWLDSAEHTEPDPAEPDSPGLDSPGLDSPGLENPELGRVLEWSYYEPVFSLAGLALPGPEGGALDLAAWGYEGAEAEELKGAMAYVKWNGGRYGVYYAGETDEAGRPARLDGVALVPEGEQPPLTVYGGPDPGDYPLPEGYEHLADRMGPIMAYSESTDGWMVFIKEGDGTYRWIACDEQARSYRTRRQSFHVQLSQEADGAEGWLLSLPGLTLDSAVTGSDTAQASVTLTAPDAEAEVVSSVGGEVETRPLEGGGAQTVITLRQPEAPVDFELIDGTRIELTYQGGYTRTRLTVPAANAAPAVAWGGVELDWLSPLTPDAPEHTVALAGGDQLRAVRREGPEGTVYVLELTSSAGEGSARRFEVDLHGTYSAVPLVVEDAERGGKRGDLRLSAVYKTLRYPLSGLVETIETDGTGVARSSPLPLGSYVVRELAGPEGYVLSNAAQPFTLSHKDQFTPLVWAYGTAENGAVSVQLDLAKGFQQSPEGGVYAPRAGAVFGVYAYEDLPCGLGAGTLVATVATGADGRALETLKLPRGRYYVQELATLPGYEVSGERFLFMADDSVQSGALDFTLEELGVFGRVTHSGYKTAELEIVTYAQLPMPELGVNGLRYDLAEELPAGTVGDGALVENRVEADRSVFTVTAAAGTPAAVRFANGASLTLEVDGTGYTVRVDGPIAVAENPAAAARETAPGVWRYNPLISHTGYTAETSAIYVAPQTALAGAGGTTLAYAYGGSGVKLAIVTYSEALRYYDDEDLPHRDEAYALGDVNLDGAVDGADLELLAAALDPELETILSENQRRTADLDGSGTVDGADLEALSGLLAALERGEQKAEELKTTAVPMPYLPEDAITFDTEGFGNRAYTGCTVDREARTITVDLSKFDFTQNPWRIYLGGDTVTLTGTDEISLDSEHTTAHNAISGQAVPDGLQPDGLTVSNGNTLRSQNRTLSLASHRGTHEVRAELAHDHSVMTITVLRGGVAAAYLSGAPVGLDGPITVAPGNDVALLMADGAVYRGSLSAAGYAKLSVEDMVPGAMGGPEDPVLSVDGSPDNFLDASHETIRQQMPMDETSLDEIRQHNSQSVTLARSDGFVRQVQVKINAVSAPAGTPGEPGGGMESGAVENDLRPYISKADATTGKELAGARIEIYDANGGTVAAGWSDENGKFYFDRPQPGSYTFREVSAPAGYQLNEEVFAFTVHPDGSVTGDNTVLDYPIPEPTPRYTTITVNKVWVGDDGHLPPIASIRVQLLRNGRPYRAPAEVRGEDGWTYTWTGLPETGVWSVEELDVPKGYESGVERRGMRFTITNTWTERERPTVDASARKVWAGDDEGTRPDSVAITLLKDGQTYETIELNEANGWAHVWTGLEAEADWSVEEPEVPEGYEASIEQDGLDFIITNTWQEDIPDDDTPKTELPDAFTVDVSAHKVWAGDDEGTRPDSVAVALLKDGQAYESVELNEANGWAYVWTGLEADADWSVAEPEVPEGYEASIEQDGLDFIITNTWQEDIPDDGVPKTDIPDDGVPQTGDDLSLWLWAMGLSAAALLGLALSGRRRGAA